MIIRPVIRFSSLTFWRILRSDKYTYWPLLRCRFEGPPVGCEGTCWLQKDTYWLRMLTNSMSWFGTLPIEVSKYSNITSIVCLLSTQMTWLMKWRITVIQNCLVSPQFTYDCELPSDTSSFFSILKVSMRNYPTFCLVKKKPTYSPQGLIYALYRLWGYTGNVGMTGLF